MTLPVGEIVCGDSLKVLPTWPENCIDTIITDPPYGLKFMGKAWDHGVLGVPFWVEALRVAKPGAIMLAFGGTRTHHRLMCAIEDAGWKIHDCLMWLYGQGFPKSLDISKAIDKAKGAKREVVRETVSGGYKRLMVANKEQGFRPEDYYPAGNKFTSDDAITDLAKLWHGWGTALKPAWEPIILAMKPCEGTYAQDAEKWGVAGLNVDGGRIPTALSDAKAMERCNTPYSGRMYASKSPIGTFARSGSSGAMDTSQGRWPANVILDEEAAAMLDEQSGELGLSKGGYRGSGQRKNWGMRTDSTKQPIGFGDSGGASRFFYCAKASRAERNAGLEGETNAHPTVKPLKLMEYLCKLTATPTGGVVLDMFAGSGSTGVAAQNTGRPFIGIELDEHHCDIARRRIAHAETLFAAG